MSDINISSFLSSLSFGSTPGIVYGTQGGVSKKYSGDGVFNVLDFGADPTGASDSAPAIQSAINAAMLVLSSSGLTGGAVVFFPAGEFLLNGPVYAIPVGGREMSITLRGSGLTATTLKGNFNGYIINKSEDGAVTIKSIECMQIINQHALGGGIRMDRAGNCVIREVQVQANNAMHIGGADQPTNAVTISNAAPGILSNTPHGQRVGQAILLFNTRRIFTVTAANATVGATYTTPNLQTFTVVSTISGGTTLTTTNAGWAADAGGVILTSGTLTKTGGTGDATITFSAVKSGLPAPLIEANQTSPQQTYFVTATSFSANQFTVASTQNGSAITTTTSETGTSTYQPHNNVFCVKIDNCNISCPTTSGAAGYVGAQVGQVEFYGCSIVGWDVGIAHSNVGLIVNGSRIESCNTGILLGDNLQYVPGTISHSAIITGNSFERVNTQLNALNCAAIMVEGNSFTGNTSVDGSTILTVGILGGTITAGKVSGNTFSMSVSNAGIDLSGANVVNLVFDGNNVNNTGTNWKMPATANAADFTFIGNNNPSAAFPFAGLPGQAGVHLSTPIEGMEYDITNGQKAGPAALTGSDLGTTVIGGGSQHVKVRYNGTNWTCAGF